MDNINCMIGIEFFLFKQFVGKQVSFHCCDYYHHYWL